MSKIHVTVQVRLQPSGLELAVGHDIVEGLNAKGYQAKLAYGSEDEDATPIEVPVIGGPIRFIVSSF